MASCSPVTIQTPQRPSAPLLNTSGVARSSPDEVTESISPEISPTPQSALLANTSEVAQDPLHKDMKSLSLEINQTSQRRSKSLPNPSRLARDPLDEDGNSSSPEVPQRRSASLPNTCEMTRALDEAAEILEQVHPTLSKSPNALQVTQHIKGDS